MSSHWLVILRRFDPSFCQLSCNSRSYAANVEYLVDGVYFRDLVEDKAGWEEAMDKDMMDRFGNPPAPRGDPVEDERGWEEALDRDLMDRFVNPPAHLSE